LRILFHSADPECHSGYGNIGRDIARRLRDAGHFVRYGTKHATLQWRVWEGIEVFDGLDIRRVNQMLEDEHFDYLISFWDIWAMEGKRPFTREKHIAWVPIDTEIIASKLITVCRDAGQVIAMTRHGERELRRAGMEPGYIPLGFDSKVFRIDPEARANVRKEFGLTDANYLIGSVGLNYNDDRKGFEPLMMAFAKFHDAHPEARLYLHTLANEKGIYDGMQHYYRIAQCLGIDKWVIWPEQDAYAGGRITAEDLAGAYNAFDVYCAPHKGEGFGLGLIEAQACGTPVITTATTSGPELCRTGRLIKIDKFADCHYLPNGAWRYEPRPDQVLDALERWYGATRPLADAPDCLRSQARAQVLEYDHDTAWANGWLPLLADMERRLAERKA
jgi:glycosyltransferase involved in cell wall biosynthesis